MKEEFRDSDLVSRFAELRKAVELTAGKASALLTRPARAGFFIPPPFLLAAIAAALLVAGGALLLRHGGARDDFSQLPFTGLSSWRSSTDFLLVTPGAQLLGAGGLTAAAGVSPGKERTSSLNEGER